jgi:putative membrane protein
MKSGRRRGALVRGGLALCGLAVAIVVCWRTASAADLALLIGSWGLPAVVALQLVQQLGCGCAWRRVLDGPRPSRWTFFRIRWIRASLAALVPVSGVGAALIAVQLLLRAGVPLDLAAASLTLDATLEMSAQIVFTILGLSLLLLLSPSLLLLKWSLATIVLSLVAVLGFVAAQRGGAFRLIEAAFERLARRWPQLLPLTEARLHDCLVRLHQRPQAMLAGGALHLGSWLLGASEIWVVLAALKLGISPLKCVVIEAVSMTARSAGFLIPGALGVQEIGLIMAGQLVGLPAETAILVAIVKRLRDVLIGVPGLLLWHWADALGWPSQRRPELAD